MKRLSEMAENKWAELSSCGTYRYALTRVWDETLQQALFVMLNPSTADAFIDDATIRKCRGFTDRWGLGGFSVCNLYPYRATNPVLLWAASASVREGVANDTHIARILGRRFGAQPLNKVVVAARGGQVTTAAGRREGAPERARVMCGWLRQHGGQALGFTKDGQPRHPLMLPYDTELRAL